MLVGRRLRSWSPPPHGGMPDRVGLRPEAPGPAGDAPPRNSTTAGVRPMHRGTSSAYGAPNGDRSEGLSEETLASPSAPDTGTPSMDQGAAILRLGVPVAGALATAPTAPTAPRRPRRGPCDTLRSSINTL